MALVDKLQALASAAGFGWGPHYKHLSNKHYGRSAGTDDNGKTVTHHYGTMSTRKDLVKDFTNRGYTIHKENTVETHMKHSTKPNDSVSIRKGGHISHTRPKTASELKRK